MDSTTDVRPVVVPRHQEHPLRVPHLRLREIEGGHGGLVPGHVLHVAEHAHHRPLLAPQLTRAPDRVRRLRPELLRRRRVDQHHRRRSVAVRGLEVAAGQERRTRRPRIAGRDEVIARLGVLARRGTRPHDREARVLVVVRPGHVGAEGDFAHARERAHALRRAPEELAGRILVVEGRGQLDGSGHRALRLEAGIGRDHRYEAAQEQAARDDERKGQRHFGRGQRVPRPLMGRAGDRAAAFLERLPRRRPAPGAAPARARRAPRSGPSPRGPGRAPGRRGRSSGVAACRRDRSAGRPRPPHTPARTPSAPPAPASTQALDEQLARERASAWRPAPPVR